ncbi:MAG: SpoIIE family protein phosphatase [Candidatus Riflebacteria bacterium]|nr:SpoIIE family protein phosphatase [Candidatus Riflebacteria bacterium]
MDSSDAKNNSYFPLTAFYFLCCGGPVILFGLYSVFFLEAQIQNENLSVRASFERELAEFTYSCHPSHYLLRKASNLIQDIVSWTITPDAVREKVLKSQAESEICSITAYIFAPEGKLIFPENLPQEKKNLMNYIWQNLTKDNAIPLNDEYKNFEYKITQDNLDEYFNKGFDLKKLSASRQKMLIYDNLNGQNGIYWDFRDGNFPGGVIVIFNKIPAWIDIIQSKIAENPGLSMIIKDNAGKIFTAGKRPSSNDFKKYKYRLSFSPEPTHQLDDVIWTNLPTPDLTFFACKTIPLNFWQKFKPIFIFIYLVFFMLISQFAFWWKMTGRSPYISLGIKVLFLFFLLVFIPLSGIGFLGAKSYRDTSKARSEEVFRKSEEIFRSLNESYFSWIQKQVLKLRQIRDDPRISSDQKSLLDDLRGLMAKSEIMTYALYSLDGQLLISLYKTEYIEKFGQISDTFAKMCIEKKLQDRLSSTKQLKGNTSGKDLMVQSLFELPESGFPSLIEKPDTPVISRFSQKQDVWYWDVYKDPSASAAFVFIQPYQPKIVNDCLSSEIKKKRTFGRGIFQIIVKEEGKNSWIPDYDDLPERFHTIMHEIELGKNPVRTKIKWQGQEYLAAGFPGYHLKDRSFLILFPESEIIRDLNKLSDLLLIGALMALVFTFGTAYIISDSFLRPIDWLSRGLTSLKTGNYSYRLPIDSQPEFAQICKAFNEITANAQEANMAKLVQEQLMPSSMLEISPYMILGCSIPATQLGGDYFDYFAIDERYVLVIAGDATGHGVPAALLISIVKATVVYQLSIKSTPEQILTAVNLAIMTNVKRALLFTMILCFLDTYTGETKLTSAGHPYPYRCDAKGNWQLFPIPPGIPLGVKSNYPFQSTVINMLPGESILFYTDGLVESLGEDTGPDGFILFQEFLNTLKDITADQLPGKIVNEHPSKSTGIAQPDDYTAVILSRKKETGL